MSESRKLVITGGGLAGIGCALQARRCNNDLDIILLERRPQILPWIDRKGLIAYPLGTTLVSSPNEETSIQTWSAVSSLLQKWDPKILLNLLDGRHAGRLDIIDGSILFKDPKHLRGLFEDCLRENRIEIDTGFSMESFSLQGDGMFRIWSSDGSVHQADRLIIATGGERNHGMKLAAEQGASITAPVAGYVRLKPASRKIAERMGPIHRRVKIRLPKSGRSATGNLNLTSRGLEGTVISFLSFTECHLWHQLDYTFPIEVDWLPELGTTQVLRELLNRKEQGGKRLLSETPLFSFAPRSWSTFLKDSRIDVETTWSRVRTKKLQGLGHRLKCTRLNISGMGLPEAERTWAGGIDMQCLDQTKLESIDTPGLFFAGEILDFVGPPGGHHQDLVWASAAVAARAASQSTF